MREVMNAIFYILRGGCAWRLLPHEFPKWQTVYHYQRAWRMTGLWERIHSVLRERLRVLAGRAVQPSACIIDAQSSRLDLASMSSARSDASCIACSRLIGGVRRFLL